MNLWNSVVLVDKYGRDLLNLNGIPSVMSKIEAHYYGFLHRAVSVFIFNDKSELLLQRRATNKYHSPNKWTNTCCTNPFPGETPSASAQRRLKEEMGIFTPLTEIFTFSYRARVGNGLIENEFDHVFFGTSNQDPDPDPHEVSGWEWITIGKLEKELMRNPGKFSYWLRQCFGQLVDHVSEKIISR